MLTRNEILDYLANNKALFAGQFGICRIGIFGSYARNEQTELSDIDVIIDMPRGTDDIFEKRMALKEAISQYFGKTVDVCHERAIKPLFKEIILSEAIYV